MVQILKKESRIKSVAILADVIRRVYTAILNKEEKRSYTSFPYKDDGNKGMEYALNNVKDKSLQNMWSPRDTSKERFMELYDLLQIGIQRGISELCSSGNQAVLKRKLEEINRKVQSYNPTPHFKGVDTVSVTRLSEEITESLLLLKKFVHQSESTSFPEFVEDVTWQQVSQEASEVMVAGKRADFVLEGDNRIVVYTILERPLTEDAVLIRIGSDYWQDDDGVVETVNDLYDEAFFYTNYGCVKEALSVLIGVLNEEPDLESGLFNDSASGADTIETFNETLQKMLAS